MVDWISLIIPCVYLGVLTGSMATFSHLYRARKASRAASLEPWFGEHTSRDIYLSLLHMEPKSPAEPKVPDSVLKAALLCRAAEDIRRLTILRQAKQALETMLQRGSIGHDLRHSHERAEREVTNDFQEVSREADAFEPGWSRTIWQSASEIVQNEESSESFTALNPMWAKEREWWKSKGSSNEKDNVGNLTTYSAER